ncbi:MAG: hypothetical protein ACFCD0_07615 [Gemmataceae bacterium]
MARLLDQPGGKFKAYCCHFLFSFGLSLVLFVIVIVADYWNRCALSQDPRGERETDFFVLARNYYWWIVLGGASAMSTFITTLFLYLIESRQATSAEVELESVAKIFIRHVTPCTKIHRHFRWDPAWLSEDVVRITQQIQSDGTFDLRLILADALEEAGCTDRRLLDHCRDVANHEPKCWVFGRLFESMDIKQATEMH